MATLVRPPLIFQPQRKLWIGAVDPVFRPLTLGINPNAQPLQLSDSAPACKRALQVDQYPNLLATTLGAPAILALPLSSGRSEPGLSRKMRISSDDYPNLLATTLAPAQSSLDLPLAAIRWDWPAPAGKRPVQAENIQRPLTLGINPNAQVQQWTTSAPERKRSVQVDVYPNLLQTTLTPAVTIPLPLSAHQWDWPAPQIKRSVRIDQPLNRPITLNPVPKVYGVTDSAPRRIPRLQMDYYPNVTVLGIPVGTAPLLDTDVYVPYLIGDELYAALMRIASIFGVPNVTGTTGTVTAQYPAHMTRVARGTMIYITLGGTIYSSGTGNSRARAPYGVPDMAPPFPDPKLQRH